MERLCDYSERCGLSVLELAFGWLLANPVVSSVIAGATTPEQVERNVKAGARVPAADELAEIESVLQGV